MTEKARETAEGGESLAGTGDVADEVNPSKPRDTPLELVPRDGWLDHLSAVHNVEFNQQSVAISVTATAAPIVLGYLFSLPDSCELTDKTTDCVPDLGYLGLPLAPLSIILFYCFLFLNSRMVGKYGRALERAIGTTEGDLAPTSLKFPALSRLNGALYGGESRSLAPFRVVFVLFALALVVVEIFTMGFLIHRISNDNMRNGGYIAYGVLLVICIGAFIAGASHSGWDDLKGAALLRDRLLNLPPAKSYGWLAFARDAVIPRVLSLAKGLDGIFLWVVLVMLGLTSWGSWGVALGGLAIYEIVLYQSRYLLNAAREVPDEEYGLPGDLRNNSKLPWAPLQRVLAPMIALTRGGLFVGLVLLFGVLDWDAAKWVLCAFLAAFYLYEIPRELARHRLRAIVRDAYASCQKERKVLLERCATGAVVPIPDPATCMDERVFEAVEVALESRMSKALSWAMFVGVGAGYALRWGVVIFLVDPPLLTTAVGVLLVACGWAYGSAQVSAGWVVEFNGACGTGSKISVGVLAKPYLYWAAQFVPGVCPQPSQIARVPLKDSQKNRPVRTWSEGVANRAPWVLAALAAACLGVVAASQALGGGTLRAVMAMVLLVIGWYAVPATFWVDPEPVPAAQTAPAPRPALAMGADVSHGEAPMMSDADVKAKAKAKAEKKAKAKLWWTRLRQALRLPLAVAAVAAVVAAVAAAGLPGQGVVALGLLAFFPIFKLTGSQQGNFAALFADAEKWRERLRKGSRKVTAGVVGLFELILGYPTVHAFQGRFSHRRSGWL